MTLEEKLNISNENIDNLLSSNVEVKLICILNNKILLDNNKLLPSFNTIKGNINDNNIICNTNELLNINTISIKDIPYILYNDYTKRYYIIEINIDDVININSNYKFYNVEDMSSSIERDIIGK